MCWNAEVSLNTFIFGFISAIIVYLFGYKKFRIILICLLFTSIQLLEYFIWTYIDNEKINELLSKIGLFLIFLQIFLVCLFYYDKKKRKYLLIIYFIILILFIIIELKNINFRSIKGENGHLRWLWLEPPIIWILIFLSFYLIGSSGKLINFVFVLLTLIISFYYYYKYKTWGTMWCYFSNIIWIYFIIYSIYRYMSQNNLRRNG
jgi:hypothetical protein